MIPASAPTYSVELDPPVQEWIGLDHGWMNLDRPGFTPALGYETTIDLSGYEITDSTFFPSAQTIQEPAANTAVIAASLSGSYLEVLEIVSQVPLDITQIAIDTIAVTWGEADAPPGFIGAQADESDIIVGRYRTLTTNAQFGSTTIFNTIKEVNFGSGEPTASDKLYVYIIYDHSAALALGDRIGIPPRRIVIGGVVAQEPDLEYIMRMRRSYALDR